MLRRGRQSPSDPSSSALTAQIVKERYEKGYKAIRAETYEFWLNYAFLNGNQWLFWNKQTSRLDEIARDPDRVQATVNKLLPASRTVIAKATSRELSFDVAPTAGDDATARSARLGEAILADVHREHDWETLREDSVWSTWRGGTAAICIEWDATAGDIGETTDAGKRVGIGDTVETVLNIAEFVVEPGARIAERARWWIRAQALPPEEVQATFGLSKAPKPDASAGGTPLQQRLLAEQGTNRGENPDLTLVLTYYERPNGLRPKGAIATVIGDEIVDGGVKEWYFPFKDRLNIAVQRETHVDGRWTGATVLTSARPVQALFNQSWSSIVEHMKLAGNARLLINQGDINLVDILTDEPGEVLPFNGPEKPSWLTPTAMPAWVIDQPEKLAAEMDDILGVHAVSRGEAPNNIQSGYGLSILSENDATPLGRLVKETATTWGKVARMVLKLYEAKAGESRTAKVLLPGQAPETMTWTGKDLKGQTNAQVPVDAILPRSRAAMQAFAEKAMQMGLITNVAQFARLSEFPQQNDLIEAVSPDVSRARRENHALALGQAPAPKDYDDHKVRIQEHNDFRKTAKYDILCREDPEAAKLVDLHIKGHETLAYEIAGKQVTDGLVSPVLAGTPSAHGAPGLQLGAPNEAPPGLPPAGMDPTGAPLPPMPPPEPQAPEPAPIQ